MAVALRATRPPALLSESARLGWPSYMIPEESTPSRSRRSRALSEWALGLCEPVADDELDTLKRRIAAQAKQNFLWERDVRYLDSRIALLIANRMKLDEVDAVLEDDPRETWATPDDATLTKYANLFYLLVTEPRHIASLCSLVSLHDLDLFLQTVMFTMYGNQYDEREEHMLLTLFQSVLSTQFKATSDFNTLLRANTPISRMMSTYTRRGPGQAYLQRTLGARLHALLAAQDDLGVDPAAASDATEQPLTLPDVALQQEEHAVVKARTTRLTQLAEALLDDVLQSAAAVPYGIRWICKQIRSLCHRKDPTVSDATVCSLIGSFFFLRFINAAIVSPQLYALTPSPPRPQARQTLVLIAKMFQGMVNNTTRAKESLMAPLATLVERHRPRLVTFLHQLCSVGDFYDTLELAQYVALSHRGRVLPISLNEMYFTHALLVQHRDVLAPDPSMRLAQVLSDLGPAPGLVPRRDDQALQLELFSRWEVSVQDLTLTLIRENNMSQSDILYMQTKALFVQLLSCAPEERRQQPLSLHALMHYAAPPDKPNIALLQRRAAAMLAELQDLHVIDADTQQALMAEEISAESKNMESAPQRRLAELEHLHDALTSLTHHATFLQGQLDTYKSYLHNVRQRATATPDPAPGRLGRAGGDARTRACPAPRQYTYDQLQQKGVLRATTIPIELLPDVYFILTCPAPSCFLIAIHAKHRAEPVMEIDVKLDDLLEKMHDHVVTLDAEYVQMDVGKLHDLLVKCFVSTRKR